MNSSKYRKVLPDFTALWVTPRNGRVVFDEQGNSVWQWPSSNDPFARARMGDRPNANSRVDEPSEFRRSRLTSLFECERPAKEFHAVVMAAAKKFVD
jgi:hypothetical protein